MQNEKQKRLWWLKANWVKHKPTNQKKRRLDTKLITKEKFFFGQKRVRNKKENKKKQLKNQSEKERENKMQREEEFIWQLENIRHFAKASGQD